MKMRLQKNLGRALAVALIGFGLARSADAQIITNGGFEDTPSLTGWSSSTGGGTVDRVGSVARKGSSVGTWTPVPPVSGSNNYFALLSGVTGSSADGQTQTIEQVFTASEFGGTLSFRYFFDSAEFSTDFNDYFRLQIGEWNGTSFGTMVANKYHDVVMHGSGDTGWVTDSVTLLAGTQYRILGTLVNAANENAEHGGLPGADFTSIAGLDDFVYSSNAPPAVPEPTSMTLLLAGGAIGLVLRARLKMKQAPANES